MKKRVIAILMALAIVLTFAACSTATPTASPTASSSGMTLAKLKIGFIYIGSKTDGGWSQAHEDGRQALIAKYPGIQTLIKENVPETADSEQAMRGLIDQGLQCHFRHQFQLSGLCCQHGESIPQCSILPCDRIHHFGQYEPIQRTFVSGQVPSGHRGR